MSYSSHDPLLVSCVEQDPAPLPRRVLKNGLAVYGNGLVTASVTVRDMTDFDARLHCVHGDRLPATFELLIDFDGVLAQCEVLWRFGHDIGVRFLSRTPAGDLRQRLSGLPGFASGSENGGAHLECD